MTLETTEFKIYPEAVHAIDGNFRPIGIFSASQPRQEIVQSEALAADSCPVGRHGGCNPLSGIFLPPAAVGKVAPKVPALPRGLFSRPPEVGVPILQRYLDVLPEEERYAAFAPLVREHWKWFCKAAPYLKFPEPRPVLKGQRVNIGIRIWRMTSGGIERVMQLLANHFEEDPRYHVTMFIDAGQVEHIDFTLHKNVTLVGVPRRGNECNINWEKILGKYPQDIVICPEHSEARNIQNILLLKLLGIRVFAQEHNFILFTNPFNSFEEKIECLSGLYSRCNAMSCLSRVDLSAWRRGGLLNSLYLPNPPTFDPSKVTPSAHGTKDILWAGQWWLPWKRPEMAVEVFAEVHKKVPDARLIMLGQHGGCRSCQRCTRRIRELGMGDSVVIAGFQKNMAPYYSDGALLLSTSKFEGFQMVMNEAKAFGLPVVCTGMPYLETLKRGCVQVPRDDVEALADALVDLLQNPEKRKHLGRDGRRDMLENFSDEAVFAKYDALMEAILSGSDAVAKLCSAESTMDTDAAERILTAEAGAFRGA
jgi:glycosyltransferase involved in cell wall biosynthesis